MPPLSARLISLKLGVKREHPHSCPERPEDPRHGPFPVSTRDAFSRAANVFMIERMRSLLNGPICRYTSSMTFPLLLVYRWIGTKRLKGFANWLHLLWRVATETFTPKLPQSPQYMHLYIQSARLAPRHHVHSNANSRAWLSIRWAGLSRQRMNRTSSTPPTNQRALR
jgi:hypothetical protein